MHLQSACTTTQERVKSSFFCRPGLKGNVHVCMYGAMLIYVLRTVLYNSGVIIYTIPRNQNTITKLKRLKWTHCSLSLALSQSMGRDLPATLSFSNIRTYKYIQVQTPSSMQEDSWPHFRAPKPSRYHVKKRTAHAALPPETKLLSHVDHPKN